MVFPAERLNKITGNLLKADERKFSLLFLKPNLDYYGGFDFFPGLTRLDDRMNIFNRHPHS